MKNLPARLKLLRGDQNQNEFAEAIGISVASISRYERGVGAPDLDIIDKICSKFDVNPKWLVFGEGLMKMPKHDGTMRHDGTVTYGGDVVREQGACPRCTELLEKLVAALNKAMQAQEQKEELLKENGELKAENARLTAELSLFAASASESKQANTA